MKKRRRVVILSCSLGERSWLKPLGPFSVPNLMWRGADSMTRGRLVGRALPPLDLHAESIKNGVRAVARAALVSRIQDRSMGKIACAGMSVAWRLRAADVLVAIRQAAPLDETVILLDENEGGGIAMEWSRDNRTLSVVLPVEGRHVLYSAREGAVEHSGFAEPNDEFELATWLSSGTFTAKFATSA